MQVEVRIVEVELVQLVKHGLISELTRNHRMEGNSNQQSSNGFEPNRSGIDGPSSLEEPGENPIELEGIKITDEDDDANLNVTAVVTNGLVKLEPELVGLHEPVFVVI